MARHVLQFVCRCGEGLATGIQGSIIGSRVWLSLVPMKRLEMTGEVEELGEIWEPPGPTVNPRLTGLDEAVEQGEIWERELCPRPRPSRRLRDVVGGVSLRHSTRLLGPATGG